jgi:hypothetical protein
VTGAGETDLTTLLREMLPRLNPGRYVFTTTSGTIPPGAEPVAFIREDEGLSLVLDQGRADELGLRYRFVAAWITLEVRSALEAVGLTAAVATALAGAGISANVVAGAAHDHLFVPEADAPAALAVLGRLAAAA